MNLLGTEFLRETQKRGHERSKWKLAYRYHKPPGAWPQKIGQSVRLLEKLLKNWTLHHCEKTKKINDQIFDTEYDLMQNFLILHTYIWAWVGLSHVLRWFSVFGLLDRRLALCHRSSSWWPSPRSMGPEN